MNDLETLRARWDDVVSACSRRNKQAASLLMISEPVSVTAFGENRILVMLRTHFAQHRDTMTEQSARLAIQGAIEVVLGQVTLIDVQVRGGKTEDSNIEIPNTRISSRKLRSKYPAGGSGGKITSIRTEYGGYLMRSKLEATFAALMDSADIPWEYEVEGYHLGGVMYLPDFHLPDNFKLMEVKGVLDANAEVKAIRLAEAAQGAGIEVIIVQRARPRGITGLTERYIAGTLVANGQLYEAAVILARCPVCRNSDWKRPSQRKCLFCKAETDPNNYIPVTQTRGVII